MKTIHRYVLEVGSNEVRMPRWGTPCFVAHQPGRMLRNQVGLWAQIDTDSPDETRTFIVTDTGHEAPPGPAEYCGSAIAGPFVWHVWRV